MRLARRNDDVRSGQHGWHLQRLHYRSARPETLEPDEIEKRVTTTTVPLGKQCYRVLVGRDLLSHIAKYTRLITIPAGEKSKTLKQVGAICDRMVAAGLDRQSFVVGLGGGMIGDLSGFVAAIYHRGIPHIQIPTTLLAMVDSSIGGKTGVDTPAGKNLIGAFHQPSLV
ncbi:MAG: 3-dehydroquinate synthase, partial [Verrucomicrobia bacterium]